MMRIPNETITPTITVVQQMIVMVPARCFVHHADSLAFLSARRGPGGSVLAKYGSGSRRVRARRFTDGEHRTKKSEYSVAGIGQPNPSCKSSFRRNCCAVPLTASERYMQSSARSVH